MSKLLVQYYYDMFTGFFQNMSETHEDPQVGTSMSFHLRERRTLKLTTPRQSGATLAVIRALRDVVLAPPKRALYVTRSELVAFAVKRIAELEISEYVGVASAQDLDAVKVDTYDILVFDGVSAESAYRTVSNPKCIIVELDAPVREQHVVSYTDYKPLKSFEVAKRVSQISENNNVDIMQLVTDEIAETKFEFIDGNGVGDICHCTLVLNSDLVVTGESIRSPFGGDDRELAKHFAYLDARRKVFPIVIALYNDGVLS